MGATASGPGGDLSKLWLVFGLCDRDRSPCSQVLDRLVLLCAAEVLSDSPHALVDSIFGCDGVDEWPEELWCEIRTLILVLLASSFRRLVVSWTCYPWCLAAICDPRCSAQDRRRAGKLFLQMNSCCLDFACAGRLHTRIWSYGQQVEDEALDSIGRLIG